MRAGTFFNAGVRKVIANNDEDFRVSGDLKVLGCSAKSSRRM
jgi:hypothetical protein